MGFNVGGTWNTTDVKSQTSTGWGLVLGKSFNYNYGSVISFDLRGRYLRGNWYGQDTDITSLLNYTGTALSEYKNTYGYTVNNFNSDVHRIALELALHLNSVRERTGWDPYIFGGVGLTFNQTYGDLLDQNGSGGIYDYSSMLANGPIQPQLSSTLDKIYDSPLDGSSNKYKAYFMPSLGAGLGYQIGKRVSLGIEHKTTFTRRDDFDGFVSTTPRLKNDLYHYTSLYLNFRFRTRGNENTTTPTDGTNSTGNIDNFNTNCPQPVITFNLQNNQVVNFPSFNLSAVVTEMQNAQGITVYNTQNQIVTSNFNNVTKVVDANIILTEGLNTITVRAQNNCGTQTKTYTVTYNPCIAAVVTFTNPTQGSVVKNPNFTVNAIVRNVTNVAGIRFFVNNQLVTGFSFDNATGLLTSNLVLIPGVNTFKIDATNNCGLVTSTASVNYDNCISPTVQLVIPSASGTSTNNPTITIQAYLKNVLSNQNATLIQNGVQVTNFSFTNGQLVFPTTLVNGLNTFTISASTPCGNTSETFTINFQSCESPIITVNNPINNSTVNTASLILKTRIDFIAGKQNVNLKLNGNDVSNFIYTTATKTVQSTLSLQPGMNVITIGAMNNCGTAIETIYVNYENCVAPIVNIAQTNTSVTNASFVLNATIQNMLNTQGISLTQNGNPINFNFLNNQLSSALTLVPGVNTFVLSATKTCGTATKTLTITYNDCIAPIATIQNPSASGSSVNSTAFLFKALVTNANNSQQIVVKQNNQTIPFNFNNGIIEANATLIAGLNTFQVTVTNNCGTDTKTTNVTFVNCTPPSIAIVNPVMNNTTINYAQFQFKSTINGTINAQAIGLKVNGQDAVFNLNLNVLTANLTLTPGVNTIIVSASNACGTVIETSTITYDNCVQPSIQLIGVPNLTQTVNNPNFALAATIAGINAPNNISFTQNGQSKPFNFSNANFTANLQLQEGLNTITITSTNTCGVAIRTLNVTLNTCVPPTASFITPLIAGTTVNEASFMLKAQVQNIANPQGISLKQNGTTISNFNFENGQITANVNLQSGLNTFTLVATNACGVKTETTTLTYNNCVAPTASFTNPINSGTTVTAANFNLTASVQNVANSLGISLKQNGTTISNFNLSNNQIIANVILQAGLNTFTLVATNACGVATETATITYNNCVPPTVNFTNPSANGASVNRPSFNLNATVQNATASGITLTQNGNPISNFGFANGQLSHAVTLQNGFNTFVVVVTNACGTATQTTTVNYSNCVTPTISFGNLSLGSTVNSAAYNFTASVQNMTSTEGITLKLNGSTISNFTFNNSSLQANVNLQAGLNTFILTATNACGTVTETKTVTYNNCVAPTASITTPSANGTTVNNATYSFSATVQNMTSADGITLKLNGSTVTNFTFTNGTIQANVNLQAGLNTFLLNATNTCGTATETRTITFNNCIAPTATITSPSANGTTVNAAAYNFTASVQNMGSTQGITLKLNGTNITNFTFNNGSIQANVNLQAGLNTFILNATNACGTATETRTINYVCQLPTIVFNPTISRGSSFSYFFSATVTNVPSQQGINFTLNNATVTDYTYQSGNIQSTLSLQNGTNTIRITATNPCGTVTKDTVINFGSCDAPVISFNNPNSLGTTVNSAAFNFSANVENMSSAQGITLKLNGATISGLNYTNGILQKNVTLQNGLNTFILTAVNSCGNSSETITINYVSCTPPVVNFTSTPASGGMTPSATVNMSAVIQNYTPTTVLIVKVNGVITTGYTNNNGILTGMLPLQNGLNTVEINANNACGTSSQIYTITRCKAMTYSLVAPARNNATVSTPNQVIQFNIFNIDNQTVGNVTQNGVVNPNFSVNGQLVVGNVVLTPGINTFQINFSNACNQISETLIINYQADVTSPNGSDVTSPNDAPGNGDVNPRQQTNPNNNGGRVNTPVNRTPTTPTKTQSGGSKPTPTQSGTTTTPDKGTTTPAGKGTATPKANETPASKENKNGEQNNSKEGGGEPKSKQEIKPQIRGGGR